MRSLNSSVSISLRAYRSSRIRRADDISAPGVGVPAAGGAAGGGVFVRVLSRIATYTSSPIPTAIPRVGIAGTGRSTLRSF